MLEDLRSDSDKARDAAAVKRDDFNHARESHAGLRQLAHATLNPLRSTDAERKVKARLKDPYRRAKRVNASIPKSSRWVSDSLESAEEWLRDHRDLLPTEVEREDGRLNSSRREYSEAANGTDIADLDNSNPSNYELAGQLYVGDRGCYQPLTSVSEGMCTDAELEEHTAPHYNPKYVPDTRHINLDGRPLRPVVGRTATIVLPYYGPEALRYRALRARSERLRRYFDGRADKLRWRGMEEYDAIGKADDKLREGVNRKTDTSGAKPLPPIARLHELFRVHGSDLIRRTGGRGFKAGDVVSSRDVRVDGVKHKTSRVAYAIASGEDPADKMVRGGTASHYRKAEGYTTECGAGNWAAQVWAGKELVTIGKYDSEDQAKSACVIYLKALEMGL